MLKPPDTLISACTALRDLIVATYGANLRDTVKMLKARVRDLELEVRGWLFLVAAAKIMSSAAARCAIKTRFGEPLEDFSPEDEDDDALTASAETTLPLMRTAPTPKDTAAELIALLKRMARIARTLENPEASLRRFLPEPEKAPISKYSDDDDDYYGGYDFDVETDEDDDPISEEVLEALAQLRERLTAERALQDAPSPEDQPIEWGDYVKPDSS